MEPRQYMLLQRRSLALSKVSRGWSNRPIFMPARAPAARTLALDPAGPRVFLPVASLGPQLPQVGDIPSRPAVIPETFRILTVSR